MSSTQTLLKFQFNVKEWQDSKSNLPPIQFTCSAIEKLSLPLYLQHCDKFLDYLAGLHSNIVINNTTAALTDYSDVIKHHIDIPTMRKKILASQYPDMKSFKADVDLMWDNYITYGYTCQEKSIDVQHLRSLFDLAWNHNSNIKDRELAVNFVNDLFLAQSLAEQLITVNNRTPSLPNRPVLPPAEKIQRTPINDRREIDRPLYTPPSEELINTPITSDEKYELAKEIDMLPLELLGEVIELLHKEKKFPRNQPIVIPFSDLENSTLRHIQAYIKEAKDKEKDVRKMHQKETIPAVEQIKKLETFLKEISEQLAATSADNTSDNPTTDTDNEYGSTNDEYSMSDDDSSTA